MSLDFFDDIFIPEHALKSPQFFDEVRAASGLNKVLSVRVHL